MVKKCMKCGAELTTTNKECPNCGFNKNNKSKSRILKDKYDDFFKGTSKEKKIQFTLLYLFIIAMLIFIIYMSSLLFIPWPDNISVNDLYLENSKTYIIDNIGETHIDEDSNDRYKYHVEFTLSNFTKELDGSKLLVYFYNNGKLVNFNTPKSSNPIQYTLNKDEINFANKYPFGFDVNSGLLVEVSDVKIIIIHDGEKILENKIPFNMSNIKNTK